MKKRKLITALCALSLGATLTACSVDTSTSFAFRWNPNSNNEVLLLPEGRDFYERYEYSVELKNESGENEDYSVDYKNGKYAVTLKADPEDANGYVLESSFTISVQYKCGGKTSEVFEDSVSSLVKFKGESDLRPTYSEKTVQSTSPVTLTASSLEGCYRKFHYKTTTTYNAKCTSGVFTQQDLGPNTVKTQTKKFSVSSKRSYLDNEQLFFALRGISGSDAQSISVFDGGSKRVRTVKVSQAKAASVEYELFFNSEEKQTKTIDYVPFSVQFSGENPGATHKVHVAKNTESNTYRNMILRIETPLSFNLGTLVYKLQKATTF